MGNVVDVATFSANDRLAALALWEKEGCASRTVCPEELVMALLPRPSAAATVLALRSTILPPFSVSAPAPMLMPSPSKSDDVTMYWNERDLGPRSLARLKGAWRVLVPMVSASCGVPVTLTPLSNETITQISSPAA